MGGRTVEIVVPVHNEEAALARGVLALHAFLQPQPFAARIVIADNASGDRTGEIARRLESALDGVRVLQLPEKGRGRALRAAWSATDADVVAYMDVDLSTRLEALPALVLPLLRGECDLAIGSRLLPESRVVRSAKRELISRSYNRLLRTALRVGFHDAQCGFKAARRCAIEALLPRVENERWFFDTELLVLAERSGLRILEVPVEWVEDGDSRVGIVSTALEDLRGIARLRFASGRSDAERDLEAGSAARIVGRRGVPTGGLSGLADDRQPET